MHDFVPAEFTSSACGRRGDYLLQTGPSAAIVASVAAPSSDEATGWGGSPRPGGVAAPVGC